MRGKQEKGSSHPMIRLDLKEQKPHRYRHRYSYCPTYRHREAPSPPVVRSLHLLGPCGLTGSALVGGGFHGLSPHRCQTLSYLILWNPLSPLGCHSHFTDEDTEIQSQVPLLYGREV